MPDVRAAVVACMADVRDVYAEPYDERRPVVGFDATSTPLIAETRVPLPAQAGPLARDDDAYSRHGIRHLLLGCEPWRGDRPVAVTAQRALQDFARQMQWRVDERDPEADVIRVVRDNLNTHQPAALYETFAPAEARRILRKLAFHDTPTHGRWWNIAEIALRVFSRQCLHRRIGDEEPRKRAIKQLAEERKAASATIEWRFTTDEARQQLPRLDPATSD